MHLSVPAVLHGGLSIRDTAATCGVPKSTLMRKCQQIKKGLTSEPTVRRGRPTAFSTANESILANYFIRMNLIGVGVDQKQLLESVKEVCKKLNLDMPFKDSRPSNSWAKGFFKRHGLSLRVGETLERGRAMVTEEKTRNWFAETLQIIQEAQQ